MSVQKLNNQDVLMVDSKGLTQLAEEAFTDIAHLLRPAHLQVCLIAVMLPNCWQVALSLSLV